MPRKSNKIRIQASRSTRVGERHVAIFNSIVCRALMGRVDLNTGLE